MINKNSEEFAGQADLFYQGYQAALKDMNEHIVRRMSNNNSLETTEEYVEKL